MHLQQCESKKPQNFLSGGFAGSSKFYNHDLNVTQRWKMRFYESFPLRALSGPRVIALQNYRRAFKTGQPSFLSKRTDVTGVKMGDLGVL